MIQRIAVATVLRGDGGCEAFYNGERDKVVEAVKAEMERQRAHAQTVESSRNRLLAEKLNSERRALAKRCGPVRRLMNRIEDAWALVAGTVIVWGEALGLLVYEARRQDERLPARRSGKSAKPTADDKIQSLSAAPLRGDGQ